MHKLIVLTTLSFFSAFAFSTASANECSVPFLIGEAKVCIMEVSLGDSVSKSLDIDSARFQLNKDSTAISVADTLKDNQKKKKRIVASCAFPFPLGFVAAHRIMLGTKPWVPVVYVATFGGCFGLLPLIDFCVILFSKDISQYENNPNIFMWMK